MPKITMSYNLPEEKDDFYLAYEGARLSIIIEDLYNYLRNKLKHEDLTEEQYNCYETIRSKLMELRNDD